MKSPSRLGLFRLGRASLFFAIVCCVALFNRTANANIAVVTPTIQPSDSSQLSPFTERLPAHKPRSSLPNDSAEAGMLREAYARLAIADHDYDGHRAKAKAQVSDAAKALGVNLKGDGKGHEPQATSDEHLRAAQGLLEGLVSGVTGPGLNHIKLAINQISVALAVR